MRRCWPCRAPRPGWPVGDSLRRAPRLGLVALRALCLLLLITQARAEPGAGRMPSASDPGWLRLVHYQPDGAVASGWRSAIHSDDFFLHPRGRTSPGEELQATVEAMALPTGPDPDQHARCRFPARWAWLRSQLGDAVTASPDPFDCPGFRRWTRDHSVDSVSVVFATGFLANPASFYGHTLLKFNFRGARPSSRLMDVSVNYGAIVEKNDGIATYLVRSLLGGYDGGFSHIQFYFHNHNYGDIELRDLWEYELALPRDAVNLIVAHAWEVLGKRYTYHFFRENCAYRMAEVLEVVDGLKVIPTVSPWVIPQQVVQTLAAARFRGASLLKDVIYHPSRQSRFYASHARLDAHEAQALEAFADGSPQDREGVLAPLPIPAQQRVLEAALDYYQFVGAPIESAPPASRQAYAQALALRYALPPAAPGDAAPPRAPMPASPHQARPLGWVQLSAVDRGRQGAAVGLRVRAAYYDPLDADAGQVPNSLLTMGDLSLELRSGRAALRRLELLGIESANAGRTSLRGDGGAAYRLHVGFEPSRLDCGHCTVFRLQGDYGRGAMLTPRLFAVAYVGGALQAGRSNEGGGFARVAAEMILRPTADTGLRLAYERRKPFDAVVAPYGAARAEARWRLDTEFDLRATIETDRGRRASVGLGRYW